jgi:hypothetical protein
LHAALQRHLQPQLPRCRVCSTAAPWCGHTTVSMHDGARAPATCIYNFFGSPCMPYAFICALVAAAASVLHTRGCTPLAACSSQRFKSRKWGFECQPSCMCPFAAAFFPLQPGLIQIGRPVGIAPPNPGCLCCPTPPPQDFNLNLEPGILPPVQPVPPVQPAPPPVQG